MGQQRGKSKRHYGDGLCLSEIGGMTDDQCFLKLAELRWGTQDQQVCPDCGAVDSHYFIKTRKHWTCRQCFWRFSITSGTVFAHSKLSHRQLLLLVVIFAKEKTGVSAQDIAETLKINYQPAFVLLHKIREAIKDTASKDKLAGLIHIDGKHVGGWERKPNNLKAAKKQKVVPNKYSVQLRSKLPKNWKDEHRNRRILVNLRQVGGPGVGATRTITAVLYTEKDVVAIRTLIEDHIAPGSTIFTDEETSYRVAKLLGYDHQAVNHSYQFQTKTGVNNNQSESYNARFEFMLGTHRRIVEHYMDYYANECAWREDTRKMTPRERQRNLMSRLADAGPSKYWSNYCRGNRRQDVAMHRHCSAWYEPQAETTSQLAVYRYEAQFWRQRSSAASGIAA